MRNKRREGKRKAAILLAALLTINSLDLSVLTVHAEETSKRTEEQTESADKTMRTITGFAGLEENLRNQQLAIGALEEDILFPDTLEVTVSVSDAEPETEELEIPESETEELEIPESETEELEIPESETEELEIPESETEELEIPESETEELEIPESETEELEVPESETEENETTASLFDSIFSAFAPVIVYAAENHELETEFQQIIDITLTGITWKLNPAESDREAFDSSEACAGYCYVYTPVLPETDAEGNSLALGEAAELPAIYVLIEDGEKNIALASVSENRFIVEGGVEGTDYSFSSSELEILTNTPLTIKNSDKTVASDIVVSSTAGANLTLSGVDIDASILGGRAALSLDTEGKVTITLAEGTKNRLKSGSNFAGLYVPGRKTLIINGTGSLEVIGGAGGAGIGGNYFKGGGTVTINGGTITATGGVRGAGIGGGEYGPGGTVTINGGTVTATGGAGGAGIGGGRENGPGGTVTINGGTITATGGAGGAGIGGGEGENGAGGKVTISGGNIKATGGGGAMAIGSGENNSDPGTVKDASGNDLSLSTITLCGLDTEMPVSFLSGIAYSAKDVKTLDTNKLYLYLPASARLKSVFLEAAEYTGEFAQTATFHHYIYKKLSDGKLQVECSSDGDKMTLAIVPPADRGYTGKPVEAMVTTEGKKLFSEPVVSYEAFVGELTEGKPVNPGVYRASIICGRGEGAVMAGVTYTITCDHAAGEILYTGAGERTSDCENAGMGHRECTKCNKVLEIKIEEPALGHAYVSSVTQKPTLMSTGVRTYTCSRCKASYTETIAKLTAAYTVSFHGNGSTSGSMSSQKMTYGKKTALRANKFKKKGYTFAGWNTKKDGSGNAYKNKEMVSSLSSKDNGKITLYAQWKATKYKITYKLNKGTNHKKNPSSYTIAAKTITLKNPTRKGYTFKGWYSDKKCTKRVKKIKKGSTGKVTLYAKWEKNKK